MKQATIMLTVLGALIAGNPSVRADSGNPFGFETDKHPQEYEYCKKYKDPEDSGLRGHGYKCSSAPRPHPDFQEYLLGFVEEVGLCTINATSNHFFLRQEPKFEVFRDQIVSKYGPPTSTTENASEPAYHWLPQEGFKGLGDVRAIDLSADRFEDGFSKFLARVSFWLVPLNTCLKKIDEKANRAF